VDATPLGSEPGVTRVVLSAPLSRALAEEVAARAAAKGLSVSSLVQEAPSLERVFADLTTGPGVEPAQAPAEGPSEAHAEVGADGAEGESPRA
jgi:hypothetical protein